MRDVNLRNRNRVLSERVIKGLESRHMHGYYAEDKEEALKIALSLIPEGSTVGYGGSMTIDAVGLKDALEKYDYLETRDKAFIKRVVEGCLERNIQIDYVIDSF